MIDDDNENDRSQYDNDQVNYNSKIEEQFEEYSLFNHSEYSQSQSSDFADYNA